MTESQGPSGPSERETQGPSGPPERGRRVAVVGGGIAGLATAWYLLRSAGQGGLEVVLLEDGDRLGGKIRTGELAGVPVEAGPDTFLARVPWATSLFRELGLGDDLEPPTTGKAYVLSRGRLRSYPPGTVLGVPTAPDTLLRNGILSPAGVARAALDLVMPASSFPADPSVADVVGTRLGRETLEVLVEPLVGGINAGRADRLSLESAAPQIATGLQGSRSLILGLRRQRADAGAFEGPLFLGVAGGMERVIDRLRASLTGSGSSPRGPATVDLRLGTRVQSVATRPDGGYQVSCSGGPDVVAGAVVLAAPAFAAAGILREASPDAATDLDAITYASVVVTTLGYRPSSVHHTLDGSGFLVPRRERWLTTACTWSTSKWPSLGQSGLVMLRASAGRAGDDRALELDDDALVTRLHDELSRAVGLSEPPTTRLVTRWPRSFPQYEPGHAARVDRIAEALGGLPGVFVTGAAYRGLGIAACIRNAQATATQVTEHLNASLSR